MATLSLKQLDELNDSCRYISRELWRQGAKLQKTLPCLYYPNCNKGDLCTRIHVDPSGPVPLKAVWCPWHQAGRCDLPAEECPYGHFERRQGGSPAMNVATRDASANRAAIPPVDAAPSSAPAAAPLTPPPGFEDVELSNTNINVNMNMNMNTNMSMNMNMNMTWEAGVNDAHVSTIHAADDTSDTPTARLAKALQDVIREAGGEGVEVVCRIEIRVLPAA